MTKKRIAGFLFSFFVVLILLLLVLLYSAPFFALKTGQNWYESQGAGYQLTVSDWHFSPFRTDLELTGVELRHPQTDAPQATTRVERLRLSFDPWALARQEIYIRDISLDGLRLSAALRNDEALRLLISGLMIPLQADNSAAAETESAAQQSEAVAVESEDIQTASVQTEEITPAEESTPKEQSWRLRLGRLTLNDEIIGWQQDALTTQGPASRGQLRIASLQAGPFDSSAPDALPLNLTLELTQFELSGAQPVSLQQTFTLTLAGQLQQLLTAPQWDGDIVLENLQVTAAGAPPLAFKHLQLSGVQAAADAQSIAELSLEQLVLGAGDAPLLSLGHYQVSDISASASQLATGLHEYADLQVALQRLADGRIDLGAAVASPAESQQTADVENVDAENADAADVMDTEESTGVVSASAEEGRADDGSRFRLFIAGIQQNGDNSGADIRDASVKPAYQGRVQIRELNISEISATLAAPARPELQKPVQVHAVLSLDDYNRIALDTSLTLDSSHAPEIYPQGNITLRISQLDMVAFNGYLAQAMGYHLEKGMLNLDVDMDMQQARLGGEARILLRNSSFVPEDEATIKRVSKQISMPVDTALDLLRDDNGNVRLTVPVSGDMSSPDFGSGDITAQLSKLALQSAALHYLKQSLQPYGLLLSIASYAGSELMAIRLDALAFAEGQTELNDEQIPQLEKVAQLMHGKTGLELQVCPFVSAAEASAQEEQWPQLARQRGAVVKAWLAQKTDENDHSLAPRVTLCKAQKGKKAEVVLGFN
ncbi:DUF748 domain-containing protein [Thalassolituus alkanivorans]|uniref:DUF748 domain-containing protein n=1 Tax=Thalassolituus alkanivorans TaxID=2881055 RepID=UPI001E3538CE|nr:DUF748 domain-containing protein [Thalassolituus alkanivorans]MCB2387456.1 DUF748 domain-containing protein [Thalassolituus alkanivorans]MCB2425137.1 DUF748 domain-containing protein [Thalassolituus alkanivorans]